MLALSLSLLVATFGVSLARLAHALKADRNVLASRALVVHERLAA